MTQDKKAITLRKHYPRFKTWKSLLLQVLVVYETQDPKTKKMTSDKKTTFLRRGLIRKIRISKVPEFRFCPIPLVNMQTLRTWCWLHRRFSAIKYCRYLSFTLNYYFQLYFFVCLVFFRLLLIQEQVYFDIYIHIDCNLFFLST